MDPREVLEQNPEGSLVHRERLPARPARTTALPADVPEMLRDRLSWRGIQRLYTHQAAAIAWVRARRHVVVATGTASGKTLCYQLPICERLLADDRSTVLYLSPTKALARDQLRSLRGWRLAQVRAATLDGDTPAEEREAIRRTANVVLTNPDLLHHWLLPTHQRWADFLHRLTAVVVDECHVARGVFGSHVALILRRLRRLCHHYGSAPTFVLASATIGNPAEHAARLTGLPAAADVSPSGARTGDDPDTQPVVAVTADGSPRGPIDVALWQPRLLDPDAGVRTSTLTDAGGLLARFVAAGVQSLVFTKSRRAAEVTALVARDRLRGSDAQPRRGGTILADAASRQERAGHHTGRDPGDAVAAYRGGYLPEERRELEQALAEGRLRGLAATSALELGIDIGGLDAVVLAGYPGTAASFWQRLGRAGRSTAVAVGVLVADDDPLDQYLISHPDELLGRVAEDAIIDPSNPYLLGPHLRCACQERPLEDTEATRWFGPGAAPLLAADVSAGMLRQRGGRHHWLARSRATARVDIRSAGGATFRIVDTATGALIGQVDEPRVYRQAHPGAIYVHQGRTWEIVRLDTTRRVAAAREAPDADHTTRARSSTAVSVRRVTDHRRWPDAQRGGRWAVDVHLGRVEVTEQVTGYEVLEPRRRQIIDRVDCELPPTRLETMAVWYTVPAPLLRAAGVEPSQVAGALHAAEHAAIGVLPLIALCDRWDVGGLSTAHHPDTGRATVFVYDGHPGGAGLAERSFRSLAEHLRATREVVAGCGCQAGCPSCVHSPKCGNGNQPLDKDGAVCLLDLLLEAAPAPDGQRAAS